MKSNTFKKLGLSLGGMFFISILAGCATTGNDSRDPLEGWNRGVYTFNENLDEYALKPVAQGYHWITPSFVDTGVTNFFSNIGDIRVTINDLLQFKLVQGGSDAARFLVNSTVGVAGLFDVATLLDLSKHEEDFGQTLGVWGIPIGPYLVLPFLGPSSPRGAVGLIGDALANPITYISYITTTSPTAISYGLSGLFLIDKRSDLLATSKIAEEASAFGDDYSFIRDAYFQRRESLVHDGDVPLDEEEFDDADLEDDEAEDEIGGAE